MTTLWGQLHSRDPALESKRVRSPSWIGSRHAGAGLPFPNDDLGAAEGPTIDNGNLVAFLPQAFYCLRIKSLFHS